MGSICRDCKTKYSDRVKYCNNCGSTRIDFWDENTEKIEQVVKGLVVASVLLVVIPVLFKLLVWLLPKLWKLFVWLSKKLWKLFCGLLKLIIWPITIVAKKPKIVLPIYAGIALCALVVMTAGDSPEENFVRAQELLKSSEKQSEGLSLLKDASKENYVPAMLLYADILFKGEYGENPNPSEAFALLEKAAELGDGRAWYLKGKCLEEGRGTIRNQTEANACYQKAAAAGYYEAGSMVRREKKNNQD